MKKVGILVLMVCLVIGSVGFADDGGRTERDVPFASNQRLLFTLPIEDLDVYEIEDFDYSPQEGLLYIISDDLEMVDEYEGFQFTFELDGSFVSDPAYPEMETTTRGQIEFDGNAAYSLEYDDGTSASYVYDADSGEMMGSLGEETYFGIAVEGNRIAYHIDHRKCEGVLFYLGELDPYTASDASVAIMGEEFGRVTAFDFSPSGSEFIHSGYTCGDEDTPTGLYIVRLDPTSGDEVDRFTIELPEGIDAEDFSSDKMKNVVRDLYATDDYLVVLFRIEENDRGYIQRYTYEGELIEGVETDFCIKDIAEGPNDSTIYLQEGLDSDYLEVMKVSWNVSESTGRPKSMISERSFGGQTIATFRDNGFGLLRVEDPETGELHYQAPLKSDESSVKLRVPYLDMNAKVAAGAESLRINYQGHLIQIPMSAFECADLLAMMPCQDDATIEIQLSADEDGNIKIAIQLFVVEQVNEMTRVVHRKTIQY